MNSELAINVSGLEKRYGPDTVLGGIDLAVQTGSVFALLGPNGAGKTTTVRILATLTRADAGEIQVAGFDVVRERHKVRRAISLTGQNAALDALQTGEENLTMMGRLAGLSSRDARARSLRLLEDFELAEAGHRRVAAYSGGMRRRLDVAASLVGSPSVIFLDEPTTGLDPRGRATTWDIIAGLAESGITIFLTTQYLEEADRLADHIAVLDRGTIAAAGTPTELKARFTDQRLDLTLGDAASFAFVAARLGSRAVSTDRDRLILGVATDGSAAHARALLDEIDPERCAVTRFVVNGATLDDVFMALTGHAAVDETRELEVA
ncbi:MAG: ATP-binding cassette domain-containing protein [Candidatus Dormibacteria bacterium]|jgi:ABC-2 type transport system ATP-binding protein